MIINSSASIAILTPHRDRPECFELCERWMRQQTYQGEVRWIVIDDGLEPVKTTMGQIVARRERGDKEPAHTLPLNLEAGLVAAEGCERFLVIENDDFYGPRYLETMLGWLDNAPLVGEVGAKYYNVRHRSYRHFTKHTHSSLCRTGFRIEALPWFKEVVRRCIVQKTPSVDLKLWAGWRGPTHKFRDTVGDARLCVGIKSMPGLPGAGHERSDYIRDTHDLKTFKLWLGDDHVHYLPFLGAGVKVQAPDKPLLRVPRRAPVKPAEPIRMTVYTAIFGGYDQLKRSYPAKTVRYVCYTDKAGPSPRMGWEIVRVQADDPVLKVRELKMNPHLLFPDAQRSLWIDGSFTLRRDPRRIAAAAGDAELYLNRHHARTCIVEEAEVCQRTGRSGEEVIRQAQEYIESGHPRNWGLYCGGFLLRRHTPAVQRFNEMWWQEFQKYHAMGASRDQISLAYVLRLCGLPFSAFSKEERGKYTVLSPHKIITPQRKAAELKAFQGNVSI